MDSDSLCWIGKNRMVCEKEHCMKEYDSLVKIWKCEETLKLVNTMTRSEFSAAQRTRDLKFDWDFLPFHCACHDVSLGKTSFPCDKCGMWVCQSCATKTYTENQKDDKRNALSKHVSLQKNANEDEKAV